MMNLVIRSRVTPFSKSRWGVMSLRGPLVSYSHSNEDHRHQSSEWLKWSWLLSEGAPLCWFLLRSSVESPRSRHTPRERAHERERGVGARCVDNEQQTSNWHGQYWVKKSHWGRQALNTHRCTHTHTRNHQCWMGSVTFDLVIKMPVNTIYWHGFVHDSVIICFPLSDLHAPMSRHFFLLLHW